MKAGNEDNGHHERGGARVRAKVELGLSKASLLTRLQSVYILYVVFTLYVVITA